MAETRGQDLCKCRLMNSSVSTLRCNTCEARKMPELLTAARKMARRQQVDGIPASRRAALLALTMAGSKNGDADWAG